MWDFYKDLALQLGYKLLLYQLRVPGFFDNLLGLSEIQLPRARLLEDSEGLLPREQPSWLYPPSEQHLSTISTNIMDRCLLL